MEALGAIVVEVGKCITIFFCSKIATIRNLHRNIRALQTEIEELSARKDEIEEDIRLAEAEGKCPTGQVKGWLRKVEEIEREVQCMLEEGDRIAIQGCSLGCDIRSRHKLGRRVAKKRDKVKQLIDLCNFQHVVIDKKSPIRAVERKQGPSLFGQKAAEGMLEQLEGYLTDAGIKRIAVWGMGGVGKTTLVRNLNNKLESSSLMESFTIVIWLTVTKDLDLREIQSEIARRLRLEFDAEETMEQRARRLFGRLMMMKFLLILDDVWEKIDLDVVGIPYDHANCKILLTTRSLDVCRHMMTNVEIKMNVLNEEAAWNLFAESAGNVVQIEDINPFARAIARKCCGLPLAVKTVGTSMRNQKMKELWMNALCELQRSAPLGSIEKDVYQTLRWSYNTLPSKIHQWCFLYCSLYPENFSIETRELIQFWIADGLIDEKQTLEESFNKGIAFIEKLKDSCLLEQGERVGTVRMHNIVRRVAIWISEEGGFFSESGISLYEMPQKLQKSFTRISFMNNKIARLPNQLIGYSKLTLLLLQGNPLTRIPENFFGEVRGLRVLNLSSTLITSLPPLFHLVELRALFLRECYSLEKLPSLGSLYKLQVLDLFGTQLRALPREMNKLSNLRELNLSRSNHLESIHAGTMSRLSSLESLDMSFSAYKWDANCHVEGRAGINEILSLERLSVLNLQLDNADKLALDSDWLRRLRKFNIFIGPRSSHSIYPPTRNDEKRAILRGVDLMEIGLEGLLCHSSSVDLVICGGISALSELVAKKSLRGLPSLKSLTISSCNSITSLISGENIQGSILPNLENLTLVRLRNLGSILLGMASRNGCLRRLRIIEVKNCPRLRNLISFALLQEVQNLEEIRVSDCRRMKRIFAGTLSYSMLPKLRVIELRDLINLRTICSRTIAWPVLVKIVVSNCPKLTKLPTSACNALTVQEIRGDSEWWNNLRWEDDTTKFSLQQRFQPWAHSIIRTREDR